MCPESIQYRPLHVVQRGHCSVHAETAFSTESDCPSAVNVIFTIFLRIGGQRIFCPHSRAERAVSSGSFRALRYTGLSSNKTVTARGGVGMSALRSIHVARREKIDQTRESLSQGLSLFLCVVASGRLWHDDSNAEAAER